MERPRPRPLPRCSPPRRAPLPLPRPRLPAATCGSSFAVPSCLLAVAPKVKLVGPGAADASPKTKTGGSGAGGGSCAPSVLRGACSSSCMAPAPPASLLLSLLAMALLAIIYASMRFRLRRCREFSVAVPSGSLDAVRVAGEAPRVACSAFVRAPPGTLVGEGDPDSVQPHSRHAFMRGLLHRPPDVAASIAAQSPTAARGGRAVLVSGRGSSRLAERGGRHGFSKLRVGGAARAFRLSF